MSFLEHKLKLALSGLGVLKYWLVWLTLTIGIDGCLRAQVPQSLVFEPGKIATASIPNSSTFRDIESFTLDLRMHNFVQPNPLAYSDIISFPGFRIFWHVVPNTILVIDELDSFTQGQGSGLQVNVGTRTDFVLRIRRDYPKKQLTAEVWNVDGSARELRGPLGINVIQLANFNGTLRIGGAQSSFQLAYVRLKNGVDELNSQPPNGVSTGTMLNYELTGNGTDTSGNNRNLSLFSGAQFAPTQLFLPVAAVASESLILRAGQRQRLDGTRSYSPNTADPLQFRWEYIDGPRTDLPPQWKDENTAEPLIAGLTFGTHTIRLTVTDSSGQVKTVDQQFGAVATDTQGLVIPENPRVTEAVGPQLRFGLAPWKYFDDRNMGVADHFGDLQSSLYLDTWNTPLAGTISVPVNSKIVTGTGTSFRQDFCNGGSTPTPGSTLVMYYPRLDGSEGRRSMFVQSCDSDTQITLTINYSFGAAANNIQYSQWLPSGTWLNGSSNANYYDNVLAHYSLYYRTGLTKYRDYARTLADRWWSMPYMDGGYACDGASGAWCLFPRLRSLTGIYLRALDGKPDYLPGLRKNVAPILATLHNSQNWTILGDVRETAYELAFVGLCAMLDPVELEANRCADALEAGVATWKRLQKTEPISGMKHWISPTAGHSSWNSQGGTSVRVTNGSTTVVGTGLNFFNTACAPTQDGRLFAFRSTNGPYEAVEGDMVKYYIRRIISATEVELDRPYQGPTASGRGWQCGVVVGTGVQPFMMGIVASAMNFAERGLSARGRTQPAAEARQMLLDTEAWLRTEAYRPLAKGFWYARYFLNCEPISEAADPECLGGDVVAAREYSVESLTAYSQAQLRNPTPETQLFADNLFGGIFGKNGGPGADSYYSSGIDAGGYYLTINNAKYLGFIFGFGFASSWPAARLGKPALLDENGSTLWDVDLANHNAVSVRLLVTQPNGKIVSVDCTGNPCRLPVDARQGSHWVQSEYLLANGESKVDPNPRLLLINEANPN
jgi:hypothetical protein